MLINVDITLKNVYTCHYKSVNYLLIKQQNHKTEQLNILFFKVIVHSMLIVFFCYVDVFKIKPNVILEICVFFLQNCLI